MTQSFLNMFRHGSAEQGTKVELHPRDRVARRSSGFQEFTKHIRGQEGLTILDLGPTSPRNIEYITLPGRTLWNCSPCPDFVCNGSSTTGILRTYSTITSR